MAVKEEKDYRALSRLGQKLGIPIFEAWLKLEVFEEGKKIYEHKQRSHSWVRNPYNMMFSQLAGKDADNATFGAGLLSVKDTDGNVINGSFALLIGHREGTANDTSVDAAGTGFNGYRAAAADDNYGILVGTGVGAESFEDNALGTKVDEGSGAGQLNHVQGEANVVTYAAGPKTLSNAIVRFLNNNSGGSIVIGEVALVVKGRANNSDTFWMQARDKLGSTVTVPDTGQLKVTYTISLVYPA